LPIPQKLIYRLLTLRVATDKALLTSLYSYQAHCLARWANVRATNNACRARAVHVDGVIVLFITIIVGSAVEKAKLLCRVLWEIVIEQRSGHCIR
jgi:hypothetical protein